MGLKSSTYVAMQAARNTYSQENFLTFLRMKGISPGSEECPIQDIEECILLYIDDIAVYTPQNIKNANKLHLLILEFVFFATGKLGFKMKKSKINLMCPVFKFLGHQFNNAWNHNIVSSSKTHKYINRNEFLSTIRKLKNRNVVLSPRRKL